MKYNINLQNRNSSYDLLRGIAILSVFCVHTVQKFPTEVPKLDGLLFYGSSGVQVFFFVSAMTMCYMWELRRGESSPILKFYVRRFLRIAPLFWLAIPVYLVLNGCGRSYFAPEGIGFRQVILTSTFLHGLMPDAINSVVPGGWSITVEMTFYLFFPFLILKLTKTNEYFVLFCFVFLVNVFYLAPKLSYLFKSMGFDNELIYNFVHLYFPSQAAIFMLGIFLYKMLNSIEKWDFGACLKFSLPILAILIMAKGWPRMESKFLKIVLWGYLLCGIVVIKKPRFNLLEALGRKSYPLYLTHFGVLTFVLFFFDKFGLSKMGLVSFLTGLVSTIILSFCLSAGMEILIERKVRRITDYLIKSF